MCLSPRLPHSLPASLRQWTACSPSLSLSASGQCSPSLSPPVDSVLPLSLSLSPPVDSLFSLSLCQWTGTVLLTMALHIVVLLSMISVFEVVLGEQPVEEELITTREVQLLGGWSGVSPESPEVQAAALKALEHFNAESKAKKYFKLLHVSSAEAQVTNMINYKITATIGKTKCRKSENADLETCDMAKKRLQCKFHVQYNPRNDELTVMTISCKR